MTALLHRHATYTPSKVGTVTTGFTPPPSDSQWDMLPMYRIVEVSRDGNGRLRREGRVWHSDLDLLRRFGRAVALNTASCRVLITDELGDVVEELPVATAASRRTAWEEWGGFDLPPVPQRVPRRVPQPPLVRTPAAVAVPDLAAIVAATMAAMAATAAAAAAAASAPAVPADPAFSPPLTLPGALAPALVPADPFPTAAPSGEALVSPAPAAAVRLAPPAHTATGEVHAFPSRANDEMVPMARPQAAAPISAPAVAKSTPVSAPLLVPAGPTGFATDLMVLMPQDEPTLP